MVFVVRLKDIKTFQFLIENRKRLKALGFDHLGLEPVFDFVLALILKIPVGIIEVSKRCERL